MSTTWSSTFVVRVIRHPDGRSGIVMGIVMGFLAALAVYGWSSIGAMVCAQSADDWRAVELFDE